MLKAKIQPLNMDDIQWHVLELLWQAWHFLEEHMSMFLFPAKICQCYAKKRLIFSRNHLMSLEPDMHYHRSSSQHCSMMSLQITVWALWAVALRVAHAAASSGLTSGGFIPSDSSSHPSSPPTHPPTVALSFPSHSRFSTAGCCSQAASWRLDVWLPRWLRMLPQDPRVNQEVVTSLRGELLSFSVLRVSWSALCKTIQMCMCGSLMSLHGHFTCVSAF